MKIKLTLIAGARPNFMKIAPLVKAIEYFNNNGSEIEYDLVHTGQHFDHNMSQSFFEQLEIPSPKVNLESGGGTQAEQTASIMIGFERFLKQNPSNLVIVVGDVTSTLACAIVSKKLNIPVAHVEGGIRSGDMSMPEEINRIVTDSITDFFFTTSETANSNLLKNGISSDSIFFVGNTMIDTLLSNITKLIKPKVLTEKNLGSKEYLVLTLHRPSNADNSNQLYSILSEIDKGTENIPVIFPVHPRTMKSLTGLNLSTTTNIIPIEPLGYLEFMWLVKNSLGVITDSGGVTEETTVLGIPCMTLRDTTERPETVTMGTNVLLGTNPAAIQPALNRLLIGNWPTGSVPPLWDGKAGERIIKHIISIYGKA